jgi:hypothetical protein
MTLPAAALERLLASMCRHERSGDFAAEWGNASPGEWNPARLEIAQPVDEAFARLEVRPWDDGSIGGVTVTLADHAATTRQELEDWAGGFDELPPMPGGGFQLEGRWTSPETGLEAILLVEEPDEPDDPLTVLAFRRGR